MIYNITTNKKIEKYVKSIDKLYIALYNYIYKKGCFSIRSV